MTYLFSKVLFTATTTFGAKSQGDTTSGVLALFTVTADLNTALGRGTEAATGGTVGTT